MQLTHCAIVATALAINSFSLRANAATIDKVAPTGGTVTLTLSADESKDLKPGDAITIQPRGVSQPLEGKIIEVKGRHAKVAVTAKKGALKAGRQVSVASAGPMPLAAPMTVEPASTSPTEVATHAGSTPGFTSSLFHPSVVSPAQYYQGSGARADAVTSFQSVNIAETGDGTTATYHSTTPTIAAVAAFTESHFGTHFGLSMEHSEETDVVSLNRAGADLNLSSIESHFTPFVVVPVASSGFQIGVAYDVTQLHKSGDIGLTSHDYLYPQVQPGIVYTNAELETGLTFIPSVDQDSKSSQSQVVAAPTGTPTSTTTIVTDDLPLHKAAEYKAHARVRLSGGDDAFGILTYQTNSELNRDGDFGNKNNQELIIGADHPIPGETLLTAAVLANTPSTDTDHGVFSTYGVLAGFESRHGQTARLGADLLYLSGKSKSSSGAVATSSKTDALQVQLTGSVRM